MTMGVVMVAVRMGMKTAAEMQWDCWGAAAKQDWLHFCAERERERERGGADWLLSVDLNWWVATFTHETMN